MGKTLKQYAFLMGLGAVIAITLAEMWRRRVHDDSYMNYLPPIPEASNREASDASSGGRVRGASGRLWSPVAASARADLARLRRVRAGAPPPGASPSAPPAIS